MCSITNETLVIAAWHINYWGSRYYPYHTLENKTPYHQRLGGFVLPDLLPC
jgi:hypothetical protein